jgi:hypothetical protein
MMLVQLKMFSLPEVVADYAPETQPEVKTFDLDAWSKSIGGEWEQVKAAAEAAKAGSQ